MKKDLKELISYIVVGGCTTLVNFIIYWLLIKLVHQGWLVANVISWIGAVIFAFLLIDNMFLKVKMMQVKKLINFLCSD